MVRTVEIIPLTQLGKLVDMEGEERILTVRDQVGGMLVQILRMVPVELMLRSVHSQLGQMSPMVERMEIFMSPICWADLVEEEEITKPAVPEAVQLNWSLMERVHSN